MRTHHLRRIVAALLAFAMLASACGSDESSSSAPEPTDEPEASTDTQASTDTEASTDTTDPAEDTEPPEPAEVEGPTGSLVWALASNGANFFDPHMATNPFGRSWMYPFYDRLTQVNDSGGVEPMLATSWEFADDGSTLTFLLREGVTFHDGSVFDAVAVKANLDRARTQETGAGTWVDLLPVESVEVLDDLTVQLTLATPGGALPGLLSDQAGMMISPAAFDNEDLGTMPVGAGPFVATGFRVDEAMDAVAFDNYWQADLPKVANLELRFILNPETRFNAVASGDVHGGSLDIGLSNRQDAVDAGLVVTERFSTALYQLFINTENVPALADPAVRIALAMAVDQEAMNQALYSGECAPTDQIFGEGWYARNDDIDADYHPYDPEAARSALEAAGVTDLEFTVITANIPSFVAAAEAMSGFFSEIGVTMNVAPTPIPELIAGFVVNKTADAYWTLNPGAADPAKVAATSYLPPSPFNPGGYVAEGVLDAHIAGGSGITDAERAPAYQEMAQLLADEQLSIAVCTPANLQVHSPDVSGVQLLSTLSDVNVSGISVEE